GRLTHSVPTRRSSDLVGVSGMPDGLLTGFMYRSLLMMLFRNYVSDTAGRCWMKKVKRLPGHVKTVFLMILKYCPMVIPSNSCWQGQDTCYSSIPQDGRRVRNTGQNSYFYGFLS